VLLDVGRIGAALAGRGNQDHPLDGISDVQQFSDSPASSAVPAPVPGAMPLES
jgi:hypothetical protein